MRAERRAGFATSSHLCGQRSSARCLKVPDALADLDVAAFARAKLLPMVRVYFPASEQTAVLEMLGRSVVFLTADNIDTVLHNTPFLGTAWTLANLCFVERRYGVAF